MCVTYEATVFLNMLEIELEGVAGCAVDGCDLASSAVMGAVI
jgi:hypothetical protein